LEFGLDDKVDVGETCGSCVEDGGGAVDLTWVRSMFSRVDQKVDLSVSVIFYKQRILFFGTDTVAYDFEKDLYNKKIISQECNYIISSASQEKKKGLDLVIYNLYKYVYECRNIINL
jgi:hypothetical protein